MPSGDGWWAPCRRWSRLPVFDAVELRHRCDSPSRRASRSGKWRYTVRSDTPAVAAMSRVVTSSTRRSPSRVGHGVEDELAGLRGLPVAERRRVYGLLVDRPRAASLVTRSSDLRHPSWQRDVMMTRFCIDSSLLSSLIGRDGEGATMIDGTIRTTAAVTFDPPAPGQWELETTHHGLRPLSPFLRDTYRRAFEAGTVEPWSATACRSSACRRSSCTAACTCAHWASASEPAPRPRRRRRRS